MKDFEGREILAGDVIVYAVRHASWMGLTRATVISTSDHSLRVKPIRRGNSLRGDQDVTLTAPTCVVVG